MALPSLPNMLRYSAASRDNRVREIFVKVVRRINVAMAAMSVMSTYVMMSWGDNRQAMLHDHKHEMTVALEVIDVAVGEEAGRISKVHLELNVQLVFVGPQGPNRVECNHPKCCLSCWVVDARRDNLGDGRQVVGPDLVLEIRERRRASCDSRTDKYRLGVLRMCC